MGGRTARCRRGMEAVGGRLCGRKSSALVFDTMGNLDVNCAVRTKSVRAIKTDQGDLRTWKNEAGRRLRHGCGVELHGSHLFFLRVQASVKTVSPLAHLLTSHWHIICMTWSVSSIGSVSSMQQSNPVFQCMGTVSVVFALAGLSSGAMLLQWHAGAERLSATKVVCFYYFPSSLLCSPTLTNPFVQANHLAYVQVHGYGYEPISQAFCLPRGLVFWSIVFLAPHVLSAVARLCIPMRRRHRN